LYYKQQESKPLIFKSEALFEHSQCLNLKNASSAGLKIKGLLESFSHETQKYVSIETLAYLQPISCVVLYYILILQRILDTSSQ
jgi:hypothetical protein